MDIPGLAGAKEDPQARERAEKEAEDLLEELKREVKAEFEDIGVLRKQMRVVVPAKIIAQHFDRNFDELRSDAIVPGFRKGHAPRRLVEKRFGQEVRESLTTTIVGQSYYAAIENAEIEVLGDPLFRISADDGEKLVDIGEALEHFRLPESGDFSYTCEIEIKPTFELPELKGIEIQAPQLSIQNEDVDKHIMRQRKIRGRLEPLTEKAAETDDVIIADTRLLVDGVAIKKEANVQLGVRATRIDGIPLLTLDKDLAGAKPGDERTVDCEIPDDYERADLRGKVAKFEFKVHELKRLVPIPTADLVAQMGCETDEQLRQFIREDMEAELGQMVERAKKEQVHGYLLENTTLDLPEGLSTRQTERAVSRRVVELQQHGMPEGEIGAKIDELRTAATEQVNRDLKLGFILEKVAEDLGVEVTDEEVNTEIARIARLYNRRFDRVRDDLQKRDLLPQLAEQIRHDKCIALLLQDARVVEVTPEEAEKKKKKPAAKKKAGKKTAAKKKVSENDSD
ncbi:MAG: trigger factor [Planctomycetes bacterium]|nr:trigger factor [Planctomycetota bacterium]